ncbi:hypothetical protein CSC74_10535 [Pseudoxanthomonas yeongjuensis]|jgi:hypothetical protein|uniref:hypothetical protein n=1 Tax=Pseudoxanthomonas yeongjuensis TaxID=377616 RepID=UPI0013907700|nr:hypothetical protein [Pseudoxanthomonas yeongjuensis]KAF1716276.1 hypothetical protein CSC74_10535 [Pseudoxanthomonas yeongjuensis]
MPEVSLLRLYLLRAMYLLIAAGLGIVLWPSIVSSAGTAADSNTVVMALLGSLSLLCLLGIRYPLRMLPLLIFELVWKTIWVVAFALPLWLAGTLDAYGRETLFACMVGVVLVPLVIPWGHVYRTYLAARGEAWTRRS